LSIFFGSFLENFMCVILIRSQLPYIFYFKSASEVTTSMQLNSGLSSNNIGFHVSK